MKRAIFVLFLALFIFFGCESGKSNKLGQGGASGGEDWSSVTGYNCASIDRCVKACASNDKTCKDDCIKGGSNEAAKIYADLETCISYNCAFMSDDEAADCADDSCSRELESCGLKEPHAGGGNNSGDSGDKPDSGGAPCTNPGALKCSSPTMVQKCDKETLVWRDFQKCKPDQVCKEGKCVAKTGGNGGNTGGDTGGSTGGDSGDSGDSGSGLPACGKESETPCVDSTSGLVWSAKASSSMTWENAKTHCENLEDGGFSNWRLPTISELRTLIRECNATMTGGTCNIADNVDGGCLSWDCRDSSCDGCGSDSTGKYSLFGDTYWFWSSSPVADYPDNAWNVGFSGGGVGGYDVSNGIDVRCVR